MRRLYLSILLLIFAVTEVNTVENGTKVRHDLWSSWYKSAQKLEHQTKDSDARRLLQFLEASGILVAVAGKEVKYLEHKPNEKFGILPLIPEDRSHPVYGKYIDSDLIAAAFHARSHVLILKDSEAYTELWAAVLLFHELWHAYEVEVEGKLPVDHPAFVLGELRAHLFEFRLLEKAGGKPYSQFLDREVRKYQDIIRTQRQKIGRWYPVASAQTMDEDLNKIFGQRKSIEEGDLRIGHVYIHICFRLIDRHFKGNEALNAKANLIASQYEGQNLPGMPKR